MTLLHIKEYNYTVTKHDILVKYIYIIYRLRGPDEKNCARGLENGPSPKGEGRFQDRGHSFSHPDRSCR